jgi:hypothetical protein
MSGQPVVKTHDHPCVLNAAVRIQKARSNSPDSWDLRVTDKLAQPARFKNFCVMIQEQEVVTFNLG